MNRSTQNTRKTGKTTRLVIDTMQRALKTPGRPIVCVDHYGDSAHDEALCNIVEAMFKELGVETKKTPNTITVLPITR